MPPRRSRCRWLEDYALFMALKGKFGGASWQDWPRELRLRLSDTDIRVEAGPEGLLLAEKARLQGLEQTVTLPESAAAPVRQGDVLGTLTVTQNGETLLEVPIRAAETVEKLTFGEMFLRLARTMCFCG